MAPREIKYGPHIIVWDGRRGKDIRLYPCQECGCVVEDTFLHTRFHNIGR